MRADPIRILKLLGTLAFLLAAQIVLVGTRFKTEKCYDEEQLRAYLLVLEAQRRDVDRIKTNCGGGPCTPYDPPMPR